MAKRYLFSLIFSILSLFLSTTHLSAQWTQKDFIIGANFNPAPLSVFFLDSLQYFNKLLMAKEAYINLFSGYTNTGSYSDKQYISEQLKSLSNVGIQMLYRIPLAYSETAAQNVFDFTTKLDLKLRQAFYGYNIQDEPTMANLANVKGWQRAIKRYDPRKLGYVNLLPVYAFQNRTDYDDYLKAFLAGDKNDNSRLNLVSYDFYPFTNYDVRTDYFYNMSLIRKMAGERPFWTYILSVKHGPYGDPTLYQLSYQVFCALAYGAKGYIFYTYETILNSLNYTYGDAIIDKDGDPTSKYQSVKMINRYVHDIVGPVIMRSDFLGAFHVSTQPYQQEVADSEYFNEDMPVLSRVGNENMLAGIFRDSVNMNDYYVLLTNKSSLSQQRVLVTFRGDHRNDIMLTPSYLSYDTGMARYTPVTADYDPQANETRIFLDFAPGEGRLIKIAHVADPYQKVNKPDKFNFDISPNPFSNNCKIVFSLSDKAFVRLTVYSIDGKIRQEVIKPTNFLAGKYFETLTPNFHTTGIYLLSLQVNDKIYTKKIIYAGR